jgi:hypothetical protein
MALIVEDGTGLEDANSYVSLDEADQYHSDRNNTAWLSLTEQEKTGRLINAAAYMGGFSFKGLRLNPEQGLSFPRYYPPEDKPESAAIPRKVKSCQCEMALQTSLLAPSDGRVISEERIEGAIDTKYDTSRAYAQPVYPAINLYLGPYLWTEQTGGGVSFGRVVRT